MTATPVPTDDAKSTAVVPYSGDDTGLGDMDDSDLVVPRLNIDHKRAQFVDNQTNERYGEIEVVILGLVKQRILWEAEVQDDAKPLCKSVDFEAGRPDPATFPWKASTFSRGDFDDDQPVLPCGTCPLKDWGSHPSRDVPWCSEQWVLPVMVIEDDNVEGASAAIITFQRGAIKPVKAYLGRFATSKQPPFVVRTKIELEGKSRGSVDFAVPILTKLDATSDEMHAEWANRYRGIREFLQIVRVNSDEAEASTSTEPEPKPSSDAPAEPEAKPEPAEAPRAADDDEEIPF